MFTMEKKVWPSLGKFYLFYPLIFPKKQSTLSKKRAKNLTCAHARSLWWKGRWKPCVWGWFSCIMVAGISSGVREIETWRYLDFRSNFPLLFFVCILSNFRAISTPQTRLYWPSVALFTWSRFFLVILILSFRRPSLPKPKAGLFFKTKLSESETFFPRPNSLKPKPRLFS